METGNDKIMKRNRELARRPIMSTPIADNLNIPNDQWITASVSGTGNITGDRSQTLIANSSWSQVNGGVPFGTSFGSLVAVRNYRGGTSEIWNGYGGFASTYCGTESQSWNDPSIASYDARNLNGTRFTPHNPPGVPAPQLFSTPSMKFVMPPALVEDTEAAAGQKQTWLEWAVDQGVGFIPVYGSARDAYRAYKEGDNLGLGLNVSMLGLELLTFGGASVAKGVVKSSLKAEKSLMKLGGKALKSKGDDALKLVDNKIDDVGRSLIDDTAGGASNIVGAHWYDDVARNSTRNANSDKVVLGHFSPTGVSYQKVAAHYRASYFKVNNWNTVTKGLSQDEIMQINYAFLRQQIQQGKRIMFSHDPLKPRVGSFLQMDVNFLRALGYTFKKIDQWTWEAVF